MTKKNSFVVRFGRSPFQTFVAFLITFLSLFLGYVFFFVAVGSGVILHFFETQPQVSAYYKTDYIPTEEEITSAKNQLNNTGKVLSIDYIDKTKALEIYKKLNSQDPLLLESVTSTMLPASLEVHAQSPKDLKFLSETLKSLPNIQEVSYAEDVISALEKWTSSVRLVGAVLVGLLLLVSFLVIALIIGFRVASKKSDISTQQLLGAHFNFIAWPFVEEGLIYGSFSAFLAWIFAVSLLLYSTPFLIQFLAGLPVLPVSWPFLLLALGFGLLMGGVVGSMAGLLAVRRFLKS